MASYPEREKMKRLDSMDPMNFWRSPCLVHDRSRLTKGSKWRVSEVNPGILKSKFQAESAHQVFRSG